MGTTRRSTRRTDHRGEGPGCRALPRGVRAEYTHNLEAFTEHQTHLNSVERGGSCRRAVRVSEPGGCLALTTWGSRMTRRTGPRGFSAEQQLVK